MTTHDTLSRVTVHMAASLDGFVARRDGRVDWMATTDRFDDGETLTQEAIEAFVKGIDCYVMGSRTYEAACAFEAQGHEWPYGETPIVVLSSRPLATTRTTVERYSGDLATLVRDRLRTRFANVWIVGGSTVCAECLQLGLADEVRYSVLPVAIGEGLPFFEGLARDVPLHLLEVKAYTDGVVSLRYEVRR